MADQTQSQPPQYSTYPGQNYSPYPGAMTNQAPAATPAPPQPNQPGSWFDGSAWQWQSAAPNGGTSGGQNWWQTLPAPTPYTPPQTTAPTSVNLPQATPAPTAPGWQNYNYQTVGTDPNVTGVNNPYSASAWGALQQAGQYANPANYVPGLKEGQKDTLTALGDQQIQAARQNAARRGTLGGGFESNLENNIQDQFNSNLSGAYRGIDVAANQQALANLLQLGGAQNAFQNQAFNQSLQGGQFNFAQQQAQAQQQALANQYGLSNAQLANQAWNALLNYNVSGANIGLQNNAQNQAWQQAQVQNALNAYQANLAALLGTSGQNLNTYGTTTGLAQQLQLGLGAQNLQQQQINNQNMQFYNQLAQQASQFGQTLNANQLAQFYGMFPQIFG